MSFSLLDIETLIPVVCKIKTLTWLKGMHQAATQAISAGYASTVIIKLEGRAVLANDLLELIDTVHGTICPDMAQLLIDLVTSDQMPLALKDSSRGVSEDLQRYANNDIEVMYPFGMIKVA